MKGTPYTAQMDILMKQDNMDEAANFAHNTALYFQAKIMQSSKPNSLLDPYAEEIKDLRYINTNEAEMEQIMQRAKQQDQVQNIIMSEILQNTIENEQIE